MPSSKQSSLPESSSEESKKKVIYTDKDVENIQKMFEKNINLNKQKVERILNYKTTSQLKKIKESENMVCGPVRK